MLGLDEVRVPLQQLEVGHRAPALLEVAQRFFHPMEALPARGAPTTRFLCVELLQVMQHTYGTGMVIQYNDGTRTQTAPHPAERGFVHRGIEIFLEHETGGSPSGKYRDDLQARPHPSRMFFDQFSDTDAQGELPRARTVDPTADRVQLGPTFAGSS